MDLLPKDKITPSLKGIKIKQTAIEEPEKKWTSLVLICLIIVLLVAGGLKIYEMSLLSNLASINKDLQALNEQENSEAVKKVISLEEKIVNVKYLFDNHLYPSAMLQALETATLPIITLTSFNLETAKSDLTVEGYAPKWSDVASQIVAFNEKDLLVASVTKLAVEKDKGVGFSLKINYKPTLIKK